MITNEQKRAWQADSNRGNVLLIWNCFDYGVATLMVSGRISDIARLADNVYVNAYYEPETAQAAREQYAEELSGLLEELVIDENNNAKFSAETQDLFVLDRDYPATFDTIYFSGAMP